MTKDKTIILIAVASVIVGILAGAAFWGRTGLVPNGSQPEVENFNPTSAPGSGVTGEIGEGGVESVGGESSTSSAQ